MYQIALCDDDPAELNKTKALLEAYQAAHLGCAVSVREFPSVVKLKAEIEAQAAFDLLLLDIYMPEQSGIDAARDLRANGFDGEIIFLTTSREHGVDAYEVNAMQYLVKPIDRTRFFTVLEKILDKMDEERRRFLALQTDKGLRRLALRDIVSCETQNHNIRVTLVTGEVLFMRMTLTELLDSLKDFPDFVRVGSIYIVNMGFVNGLTAKSMLLTTGQTIWLPRGSYAALKEQYFKFYRER